MATSHPATTADQDNRNKEGGIPAQLLRPGHAIHYGSFAECISTWTGLPENERGLCFIALSEAVNGLTFLKSDDIKELAARWIQADLELWSIERCG